MLDEYRELIDLLAQTPTQLKEVSAAAGEPPEGEWDVNEVVAHMAATEQSFLEVINTLLRENEPYLRSFGAVATARQQELLKNDLATNLGVFGDLRGEIVSTLMSLALNLWERSGHYPEIGMISSGHYPEIGMISVESAVEMIIDHDADHIQQIQNLA